LILVALSIVVLLEIAIGIRSPDKPA
jgi:hypothetical protein